MYRQTSKLGTCKGGKGTPPPHQADVEKCILPCCDYRKLNSLAIAGTLVYVGYLCGNNLDAGCGGYWESGRPAAAGAEATRGLQAAAGRGDGRLSGLLRGLPAEEVGPPAVRDEVREHEPLATSIALIGERHSGTNWITGHLVDCFGDRIPVEPEFARFKHWFQFDDPNSTKKAAVVAMFRDPYDWVEAMREEPHHALDHVDCPADGGAGECRSLEWSDFVARPWTASRRGPVDRSIAARASEEGRALGEEGCLAGYSFQEVIPCDPNDSGERDGLSNNMYELMHDGSHRAYGSVVDLRREKILNFMEVPGYRGAAAFFPERYEELYERGTGDLLKALEGATGLRADCAPIEGRGKARHKDVDPGFVEWMDRYNDWEAEATVGYARRKPVVPGRPEGGEEGPAASEGAAPDTSWLKS